MGGMSAAVVSGRGRASSINKRLPLLVRSSSRLHYPRRVILPPNGKIGPVLRWAFRHHRQITRLALLLFVAGIVAPLAGLELGALALPVAVVLLLLGLYLSTGAGGEGTTDANRSAALEYGPGADDC